MDELAGAGVTLVPTGAGMKTCSKCRESKPLDQFGVDRRHKDGKQSQCVPCQKERLRRYRAQNRERLAAANKAWRVSNPELARSFSKRWRTENNDHARRLSREWRADHPERARWHEHRRRSRQACAVPQRWQIHDVLPFCCYWCGSNLRAYGATTHVDHVMPISLGGPAVPSNEVMTCATCNLRKSAKHPLVWIAELTA